MTSNRLTANTLYLLDTNILVHQVRADITGRVIRQTYDLLMREPKPLISAATQGELRSLILQFGWGKTRIDQAFFLLSYFTNFPINTIALYENYAAIDAFSRSKGVKMGKNDLWIAATAAVTSSTLLTTDADFDHLPADLLLHERVLVQMP